MMQKSTAFISPVLNINHPLVYSKIINTYLGDVGFEGDDSWGNYLYVDYEKDIPEKLRKDLQSNPMYTSEIHDEDKITYIFKFNEEIKQTIVDPFLKGKYSDIDRNYVKENFYSPKKLKQDINHQILTKNPALKAYWEERIGTTLPENAEVWSKATKEEEVRGYKEYKESLELA